MLKGRKNFVTVKSEGQGERNRKMKKILNRLKEGSCTPHLFYNVKKLKQIEKKFKNWNRLSREEEKDSELV